MARVKMQEIVDKCSYQMRRALEDAVNEVMEDPEFDAHELYRAFRRAVGRKCNTWERVPDHLIQTDGGRSIQG